MNTRPKPSSRPTTLASYWRELGQRTALVFAPTGEATSFEDLEARSRSLAVAMRKAVPDGSAHVSILLKNGSRYLELCWAAIRGGMLVSGLNWHLKPEQISATAKSAESKILFSQDSLGDLAALVAKEMPTLALCASIDGERPGMHDYSTMLSATPLGALDDVPFYGEIMFFSSGSTGNPKGIRRNLSQPAGARDYSFGTLVRNVNGVTQDSVIYVVAPLYHLASLGTAVGALAEGAQVVISERFDAEQMLSDVQRYGITHLNLVPTMMIRIMKLPEAVRLQYDMSSLVAVFHGAGPCPIPVKRAMIDWLGPILIEGYGGSEMIGTTRITSAEWLEHPGSVGKHLAGGRPVILDAYGNRAASGEVGRIFFADPPEFELIGTDKQPERGPNGEMTLGDLGWMDEDGYLFITGRADFAINRGGVKLMPQDIEAACLEHPAVADALVVGAYHAELGQVPVAIIQPEPGLKPSAELSSKLSEFLRSRVAEIACPSEIWFSQSLPRVSTGKIYSEAFRAAFDNPDRGDAVASLGLTCFARDS